MRIILLISLLMVPVAAAPAKTARLPGPLQAQVHDGQQLRYDSQFTIRGPMTDRMTNAITFIVHAGPGNALTLHKQSRSDAGSRDNDIAVNADGQEVRRDRGTPYAQETPLYNTTLFGVPPATLAIGTTWANRIHGLDNPLGPPFGIVKVTVKENDRARHLTTLDFVYTTDAGIRYPADHGDPSYISHDVARTTGSSTYENGTLTLMRLNTVQSHDMANGKRITYTVEARDTLQP